MTKKWIYYQHRPRHSTYRPRPIKPKIVLRSYLSSNIIVSPSTQPRHSSPTRIIAQSLASTRRPKWIFRAAFVEPKCGRIQVWASTALYPARRIGAAAVDRRSARTPQATGESVEHDVPFNRCQTAAISYLCGHRQAVCQKCCSTILFRRRASAGGMCVRTCHFPP